MQIHIDTVPAELKALHQWVLLKEELRNGKPTKIPYQVNGNRAKAYDPNTWTDFQTVCNHRDSFSDIGFVFSKDDPYCGIYIHNCIDSAQQAGISRWAGPLILGELRPVTYGEVSSSRNAIKFWTRAKLPDSMKKGKRKSILPSNPKLPVSSEIELYHYGRYFTVTGEGGGEIKDGQAIVDGLMRLIERRRDREINEYDVYRYFFVDPDYQEGG